jgi:hypothetical protein
MRSIAAMWLADSGPTRLRASVCADGGLSMTIVVRPTVTVDGSEAIVPSAWRATWIVASSMGGRYADRAVAIKEPPTSRATTATVVTRAVMSRTSLPDVGADSRRGAIGDRRPARRASIARIGPRTTR